MTSVALQKNDAYMRLIHRFRLVPIRNEKHLDAALEILDELLDRAHLTAEENDYLTILIDQIERFEGKMYPAPDVSPIELVKYLMECNDLKSSDMVPIFGNKSVVSEVLSGKRQLSKTHIANLAARFKLSPAAFFPTVRDLKQR